MDGGDHLSPELIGGSDFGGSPPLLSFAIVRGERIDYDIATRCGMPRGSKYRQHVNAVRRRILT